MAAGRPVVDTLGEEVDCDAVVLAAATYRAPTLVGAFTFGEVASWAASLEVGCRAGSDFSPETKM